MINQRPVDENTIQAKELVHIALSSLSRKDLSLEFLNQAEKQYLSFEDAQAQLKQLLKNLRNPFKDHASPKNFFLLIGALSIELFLKISPSIIRFQLQRTYQNRCNAKVFEKLLYQFSSGRH